MKKNMKKIMPVMVACAVAFAPITNTAIYAHDNTTTTTSTNESETKNDTTNKDLKPKKIKNIKIRYKTTDKSKTYKGTKSTIKAENMFERVVLKGKQKGIKKINKQLKKYSKNFFKTSDYQSIHVHAKSMSNEREIDDTYFLSGTQRVSFVGKKYISIVESSGWYAGGVHNTTIMGHTFNLKTGKEIKKITKFTRIKKLKKLKKAIKKEVERTLFDDPVYKPEIIDIKRATDFDFYIDKDGSVKVCFQPYEIASGGWYREYTLKGRVD